MKNMTTLIGITGNIATGKSVVRRMLTNAGAFGLDADVIGHRMIYPSGPAYQDVVNAFGEEILADNGEISRTRLGKIVFNNPDQLAKLESIVHPAVSSAVQQRIRTAHSPLAALEAIKLLEAGLGEICDTIWVSHAPQETQLERLLHTRHLTEDEAWTRINIQPPQEEKLEQADVVIHTNGPFHRTWDQVIKGLNDTIKEKKIGTAPPLALSSGYAGPSIQDLPFNKLLELWEGQAVEKPPSLFEALGLRMVQPLTYEGQLHTLLLWEDWNFTATLTHVLPGKALLADFSIVREAFSAAARSQGCEILLLPNELVKSFDIRPETLGFTHWKPDDLPYHAWRFAAQSLAEGERIWAAILTNPLETDDDFQLE